MRSTMKHRQEHVQCDRMTADDATRGLAPQMVWVPTVFGSHTAPGLESRSGWNRREAPRPFEGSIVIWPSYHPGRLLGRGWRYHDRVPVEAIRLGDQAHFCGSSSQAHRLAHDSSPAVIATTLRHP